MLLTAASYENKKQSQKLKSAIVYSVNERRKVKCVTFSVTAATAAHGSFSFLSFSAAAETTVTTTTVAAVAAAATNQNRF